MGPTRLSLPNFIALLALTCLISTSKAQDPSSCSTTLSASYPSPSVAPGYRAQLVAQGFNRPRGLIFDTEGHLLVVDVGSGIVALTLDAGGTCVTDNTTIVQDTTLTHSIELSADGATLYASNVDKAYSWQYDANALRTTSDPVTIVQGMNHTNHVSRTLLLSRSIPGLLLISQGSQFNVDEKALDITTGVSHIRSFNLSGSGIPYTYRSDGETVGWGLRNSVGVAEHPITGGIYSVENSADDISRDGEDIHANNPGEELNFHGYLNGTENPNFGANFGYPTCYAVWAADEIPSNTVNLTVGQQFAIGTLTQSNSDTSCQGNSVPPRLTFPAHWAPLDIKFNSLGSVAYITGHGSWNRDEPDGYLVFAIPFDPITGEPIPPANSTTSWTPILSNPNNDVCPNNCFRPTSLAWDRNGRLYMSSDSTGEIYVITSESGGSINNFNVSYSGSSGNGTGSSAGDTSNGTRLLNVSNVFSKILVGLLLCTVILHSLYL